MKFSFFTATAILTATLSACAQLPATKEIEAGTLKEGGIVSHIKVLSDKVEDVSSMEAWKANFLKPEMTEREKAMVVYNTIFKFRHQTAPPCEYLGEARDLHEPIKTYNVYGYAMCCCASANLQVLGRYAGLETRGWGINRHCVAEMKVDGKWSMFDSSLINFFNLPDGKGIASVEEICDSVGKWLDARPEYKDISKSAPLYDVMRWGQWKRHGPDVLKGSATFDENGWQPAKTHAWGDTILEYAELRVKDPYSRKVAMIEYGAASGYQVNIQLRPGEKLIRNWGHKGLDVNQLDGREPASILNMNPQTTMRYASQYGDMNTGRVGNGTLEYNPPLKSLAANALTYDNLTLKNGSLRAADPSLPATLIIRMPTSYVYLDGKLNFSQTKGIVAVSISDNNGLDWKPIPRNIPGVIMYGSHIIDLKPYIARKYDYRLKFELKANADLSDIKLTHDVQHSQRILPNLDIGDTKITFSSAAQEGTIAMHGDVAQNGKDPATAKNVLFSQFHPTLENVEPAGLKVQQGTGTITIPVTTPGNLTRIRMGIYYRAAVPDSSWTAEVSFDQGKTFAHMALLQGPKRGDTQYIVYDRFIPANTKNAIVRLTGKTPSPNNLNIRDLALYADYLEPAGKFAPVKITYQYEENGKPRKHTHIATSPSDSYIVRCESKPKMKSITLELAQ